MKHTIVCICMITLLSAGTAFARTWTSVSGAKLEAEFIGRDGAAVMLQKADGKQLKIEIDKLSQDDRTFLESLDQPTEGGDEKPAAQAAPQAAQGPLFGFVTYAPTSPLTVENFPTIPLRQPNSATYWGFQYGPAADEVLYIAFDQPTLSDLHDIAYLYSPKHPKYRKPLAMPGKKSKHEEDRVMRFADIVLQAKHGDCNATYTLEFVYGIERADIVTVFIEAQLIRRGTTTKFLNGNFINEDVAFEGTIPVVQALRPTKLNIGTKNKFGKVDVSSGLTMGGWHLVPESGMDKDIQVQIIEAGSDRITEKLKIEIEEDAITNTRHGGAKTRVEKVERGKTYQVTGTINLGPVLGVLTDTTTLKMPDEKEEE